MKRIIGKGELVTLSNEELIKLTKDHGVFLYMHDKTTKQVRVKDLVGSDDITAKFLTNTGLQIFRQGIEYIEIID